MKASFTIRHILQDHWDDFLSLHPAQVRPVVKKEVKKALECGDPAKGHALYFCPDCSKFKYVPFRCKSRFCCTCGAAYQMDRASSIEAKLIRTTHRHVVFTIAQELRVFFLKDRTLLHLLFQAASSVILSWFAGLNRAQRFTPGIVCVLHTFGRDLKWNPHIHMLVTEGGSGNLAVWRRITHFPYTMLRKRWQTTLLFLMEKALGQQHFRPLKNHLYSRYPPDGFYVHAPYRDLSHAEHTISYITRYIGRPAMAQSRITSYDGTFVSFWYESHEDGQRKDVTLHAHDFLSRLIRHIPQHRFRMLRYYGLYAKKHPQDHKLWKLLPPAFAAAHRFHRLWAFRTELSFGFDPLKCSCGSYMQLAYIVYPNSVVSIPP